MTFFTPVVVFGFPHWGTTGRQYTGRLKQNSSRLKVVLCQTLIFRVGGLEILRSKYSNRAATEVLQSSARFLANFPSEWEKRWGMVNNPRFVTRVFRHTKPVPENVNAELLRRI